MLKVMTLIGTRPELIKMSRVIAELDKHVKHILVHSDQNYDYELNQIFFDDLEILNLNLSSFATFFTLFPTLNFFLSDVVNFIIFSFLLFLKYTVLFL